MAKATFKTGKKAKMKRTIDFKFGQSLSKGREVEIRQVNENTCMVRMEKQPTLEFIVSKDALELI